MVFEVEMRIKITDKNILYQLYRYQTDNVFTSFYLRKLNVMIKTIDEEVGYGFILRHCLRNSHPIITSEGLIRWM